MSSVFSLLGSMWRLDIGPVASGRYAICLHRVSDRPQITHFSFITSVQVTGTLLLDYGLAFGSRKAKINVQSTALWIWDLKTIGVDTEVTVVCLVTDILGTTSNETVEVVTLTDIDAPLPVKNLHYAKLPSGANLDTLSRDLGKLLENKVVSDINMRCGDRTIATHKAILAARSQVFSAMFQSRMLESETGVVDIADVDAHVLELFLKYVYSGRLPDVSDELLPSLYSAADKYAVGSLKTACSERMVNNLTRENCLNVLLLANKHSDQDLKNVILNFILNHMEILKSQEWATFCSENQVLSIEVLQTVVQQKCF